MADWNLLAEGRCPRRCRPVAITEFKKAGLSAVFDRDRIAIVLDHSTPCKDIKSAQLDVVAQHQIQLSLHELARFHLGKPRSAGQNLLGHGASSWARLMARIRQSSSAMAEVTRGQPSKKDKIPVLLRIGAAEPKKQSSILRGGWAFPLASVHPRCSQRLRNLN